MGLESTTTIGGLDASNPVGGADPKGEGDNHLRLLKTVLQATFRSFAGPLGRVQSKSGNYTLATTDNGSFIVVTSSSVAISATGAALGSGVVIFVGNASSGAITVGSSTLAAGEWCIVFSDGTNIYVQISFIVPQALPTGACLPYYGSSAPSGYVLSDGKTIGDATSSATERANADCEQLFLLLWGSMADAQAPVSGGRGASAAADWAAHKRITLPDARGRGLVGKDNMGGTSAARLSTVLSSTTLGAAGGDQLLHDHTHVVNDPTHTHTFNVWATSGTSGNPSGGGGGFTTYGQTNASGTGITINPTGGGSSQNVQPSLVANIIVKL